MLLCVVVLQAKVELPSIISDNMVLQQGSEVALWGWTAPGRKVVVSGSWARKSVSAVADENGKFIVRIPTCEAGGPYTLCFNDGDKTVLNNVLLGEVWFCSGQSNMEMPMEGFINQPVEDAAKMIATAKPSRNIRMVTVTRRTTLAEQDRPAGGSWEMHTPEAVAKTSATAYYFADLLEQTLGVPVGLLITNWGGTPIEAWMDRATIEGCSADEFDLAFLDGTELPDKASKKPCTLFNGQVAPLVPYTFKGMIWYQGCDNINRAEQYTRLQPAYVKMMRERFGNPDAPFYFVQLAPYKYKDPGSFSLGYMCEAQARTLDLIPHSGMAATLDAGEFGTIHPCKKQPVGERLALLALQDTYGIGGFDAHTPLYESMRIDGASIIVQLRCEKGGIAPIGVDLPGFELAGEDKVFHPATGLVRSFGIVVTSPEVEHPVAVRYGFRNWSEATLFNNYGIPVGPFRSDNWDDIER